MDGTPNITAGRGEAAFVPPPPHTEITLTVNGDLERLTIDNRATLLDVLRERLGRTGTKKGCDHGQCGACTVLLDGRRINSCLALAVAHDGAEIVTVEGLADGDRLHPLQAAFIERDAFQCGYCTPASCAPPSACSRRRRTAGRARRRPTFPTGPRSATPRSGSG